jgi:Kef-type K+ transport system membrane component KefB/Trk K+ transport system NAD-binding subunit
LDENSYQLLLISGIAVLIPIVVSRVPGRLFPAVVIEILAGIAVGTSGAGLIDETPVLTFLAGFGFAYLMFLSGLEIDFSLILDRGKSVSSGLKAIVTSPLWLGFAMFAGTLAVAFAGVLALRAFDLAPDVWLTTLILSTTSVGIVVPTLKESGVGIRPLGQAILVGAFVADFVTLLLISVFAVVKEQGPGLELTLILILPIASLAAYLSGSALGKLDVVLRTFENLAHETAQLRVRLSLALMLSFVVLADMIGTELILGSFVAGAIVALFSREQGSALRLKLDAIGYGFFIPIFFIHVGATLDLGALADSRSDLTLVPLLVVIAYGAKFLPALLLRLRFSWRETFAGGALLSSRLSLIIAASLIGVDLGIITPGVNSAIVLLAVITSTVSPVLFASILGPRTAAARSAIIVGAGETGRSLAKRLTGRGVAITLIDTDLEARTEAGREGFKVVAGKGDAAWVLKQAGADSAESLVAVTPDDSYNLAVCQRARSQFGVPQLVAKVADPERAGDFVRAGVRPVTVPHSTSAALEHAVLRPGLFQILIDRPADHDVLETTLTNPDLIGKRLYEVRLPGNCLILLIRRDGDLIVPRGSTMLTADDQVTVAGDAESARRASAIIGGTGLAASDAGLPELATPVVDEKVIPTSP